MSDSELESDTVDTDTVDTEPVETEPVETDTFESEAADTPEVGTDQSDDSDSLAPVATAVLVHIVRSIVDDPEAVRVEGTEGRNRVRLEVKVGPGDLGRVIGRRGRTAQSIRSVVRAAAARDSVEVDVDFAD